MKGRNKMVIKFGPLKKVTCTIGIVFLMLSLFPMALPGQIGEIFAEEDAPPEIQEGNQNGNEASDEEAGVCGVDGCESLPAMEEGETIDGSYIVEAAIPNSGNAAMTGDLTVEDTTFEDVPAICGEKEDVIYIGQATNFSICAVTDTNCINNIRSGQGQGGFTDDEADQYGRKFDTIFRTSNTTNDFNPAITAFRWITGNVIGDVNPFDGIDASTSVSTWIGLPDNSDIQALAWYLGDYCYDDCPEAQRCSNTCGYEGGDVADGRCGTIHCGAIQPPAAQECPTTCGYEGGEVPDGNCGTVTCNPVPVPEFQACPTACGYTGGDVVPDGNCGTITCQATPSCSGKPGNDDPSTPPVVREIIPAVIPVTDAGGPTEPLIIPVTGVDYTMPFAGLLVLSRNMGLLLFGVTMILEGIDQKRNKK
jgi:hypothetical protein